MLLPEEALRARADAAASAIASRRQPPGRTCRSSCWRGRAPIRAAVAQAMDLLGNVTVLERPTRMAALVSASRTALRARQRQYQLRDHLAERERRRRSCCGKSEERCRRCSRRCRSALHRERRECRRITGEPQRQRAAAHVVGREPLEARPSAATAHFRTARRRRAIPCGTAAAARGARRTRSQPRPRGAACSTTAGRQHARVGWCRCSTPAGSRTGPWAAIDGRHRAQARTRPDLREADRRKDEFLAILAHELRNPLAPIRNSLHMLRLTAATTRRLAASAR